MSWEWLIWVGTGTFTLALIPQLIRTLKLGRADDMSVSFIGLIIVASACTLAYWLIREEWVAASGFVANLVVWSVVMKFRLWPREA